jgi:ATP-dependent Clp protease protease subunit
MDIFAKNDRSSAVDINYGSFRKIMLTGEVDEVSAKEVVDAINLVNHYDDERAARTRKNQQVEREPIQLIINSVGGSIYDGFAIVAAMEASDTPVHTAIWGQAMSMGFIIALCGEYRTMHKYATIMYHELSSTMSEKLEEQKRTMTELIRLQKMLDNIVLKKSKLKKAKLDEIKKMAADFYISADQAKETGIVHKIF